MGSIRSGHAGCRDSLAAVTRTNPKWYASPRLLLVQLLHDSFATRPSKLPKLREKDV